MVDLQGFFTPRGPTHLVEYDDTPMPMGMDNTNCFWVVNSRPKHIVPDKGCDGIGISSEPSSSGNLVSNSNALRS